MKLYTEEQVIKMLGRARLHNQNDTDMFTDEYLISCETHIYLPNNNEIEEISKHEILYNDSKRSWWLEGAKWMIDTIKLN